MKASLLGALKAGAALFVLGGAALSVPAIADEAAEGGTGAEIAPSGPVIPPAGREIIVTGTLIASGNARSAAPITTLTSQDIALSGAARMEDILNALPQVSPGQTSNISAGASGTATVDLRGLGANRTLVLIDGRRLSPGDPGSSVADLNFVPTALVKRVDVLTGGASATYGADAVAGVVNFVMDSDFTGFRISATNGLYAHDNANGTMQPVLAATPGQSYPTGNTDDGRSIDATISFGTRFADGRGHIMAYLGYRTANPVAQSARDYSSCTLQNATTPSPAAPLQCGGSLYSANGNALFFVPGTPMVGTFGPGTLTPGALTSFNTAPQNYLQRPDDRYTSGFFADYDISPAAHPYVEFMFMNDRTTAQLAPSGDFGDTLTINCDNPLLSGQQHHMLCGSANKVIGYLGNFPLVSMEYAGLSPAAQASVTGLTAAAASNTAFLDLLRRNVEGGPRTNQLTHTSYRTVVGSRGDLGHGWGYDAYFQYGRTDLSEIYSGEVSKSRLANALDVVSAGGVAQCAAKLQGTDPACVPYDIFSGNGPSAAALSYIGATGTKHGTTSESILSGQLTGDLGGYGVKTPWARGGVTLVLGGQWRRESTRLSPDTEFQTGDLAGQGGPSLPIAGAYTVGEFIGEANVPLVERVLTFNAGYRYSRYALSGGQAYGANTWKLDLDFTPVSDLRFRGGINRAVRAPGLQELFAQQYVGIDGTSDPCAGFVITAANTGCLAQGLHVGQYVQPNPSSQYNGLHGGTTALSPEVATTKTLGAVLQPHWLRGLSLSADWFDIRLNNAIRSIGADAILAGCTNAGNAADCGLIHRDPTGSLWLSSQGYVSDLNTNIGSLETRGFDFNGAYGTRLGHLGVLALNFVGTLLSNYTVNNGISAAYDCAGYFGPTCGSPMPKWRHQARLSFTTPGNWGVSLQWRFIGPVDVQYLSPSATLAGSYYAFSSHIDGQSYFDLTVSKKFANRLLLRAGVNNLFDKDPPLVTSGSQLGGSACAAVVCNGNTYPGTYDALGRYIYTSATLDF